MPRIMAIDPGERRTGVALSDERGVIAFPHSVLPVRGYRALAAQLAALAREKDVQTVLVGFPVREDGYEGAGCRRSRRLLGMLREAGIDAMLWEEGYTSVRARQAIAEQGVRRRKARSVRDAVAASLILRDYLDQRNHEHS